MACYSCRPPTAPQSSAFPQWFERRLTPTSHLPLAPWRQTASPTANEPVATTCPIEKQLPPAPGSHASDVDAVYGAAECPVSSIRP